MIVQTEQILSPRAFERLARLVHRHSRVRLGAEKRLVLANRLRPRLGLLGLSSGDAYARQLESSAGGDELDVLIDLATTHYTRFFREPGHFDWLVSKFLPDWSRREGRAGPCRVWSAATSSGEEAWTLALLLAEAERLDPAFTWELDASDISGRMLALARRAIYPEADLEPVAAALRRNYFERGIGPRAGSCRVQAALRQRVRFTKASLFDSRSPVPTGLHLIFCRNVMIYFDAASRAEAVRQLKARLAPGGHLLIGASESLLGMEQGLKAVQPGIYRLP